MEPVEESDTVSQIVFNLFSNTSVWNIVQLRVLGYFSMAADIWLLFPAGSN